MSSLTAQESSESNPQNPVNEGTTSAPGTGTDPGAPSATGQTRSSGAGTGLGGGIDKESAGTLEKKDGEGLSQDGEQGGESASVLDSVEKSVHERGEGEHSRAV